MDMKPKDAKQNGRQVTGESPANAVTFCPGACIQGNINSRRLDKMEPSHATQMKLDIARGIYTIEGRLFWQRTVEEVLGQFNNTIVDPKVRRGFSVLMSQASGSPVINMQMKATEPANDRRPRPFNPSAMPGAGEFVSLGLQNVDMELFLMPQPIFENTSYYDLAVSDDGKTATLVIAKAAKLCVGTDPYKMTTVYGSLVVEEKLTINLEGPNAPTVTDVRVAQRFSNDVDFGICYLQELPAVPQPPQPQV